MTPAAAPSPSAFREVSQDLIRAFGDITEDRSAIHFDADVGRAAGYGGPIAHGLLSACWAVGDLSRDSKLQSNHEGHRVQSDLAVRLTAVVHAGDSLATKCLAERASEAIERFTPTRFESVNQQGRRTAMGSVTLRDLESLGEREAPAPWPLEPWRNPEPERIYSANDMLEHGPRGRCPEHVVAADRVAAFAEHTGDRDPLYLDEAYAARCGVGVRLVPPMLSFCLAFSDFLGDLLSLRMPAEGFAGHLGDEWTLYRPIRIGERLHARHRVLSSERSKSRPGMGIVRFGLQLVDERDSVVQAGHAIMMIPWRSNGADDSSSSGKIEPE